MGEHTSRSHRASTGIRRVVFWYVLRSCERSELIDQFAGRVHGALLRTSSKLLHADPLRALHVLSHHALRSHSVAQWSSSMRLIDAVQRMRRALTHLPPRHHFVVTAMHAHARTITEVALELQTSLGMTALYYEQARAMLRAFGSCLDARSEPASDAHLLIAQGAAHWLFRGRELPHLRDQFVDWILTSPAHVRELLIGCVDEWLLDLALGWK